MSNWKISYHEWKPELEKLHETLCTLGNGYFATRGAREESAFSDRYAGTYLAGGFNRAETLIEGKLIQNEDLVNWPDWTSLNLRIKGGDWFSLENSQIIQFSQELDIQNGILSRNIHFKQEDNETRLETRRFVSMEIPHTAGIGWTITPLNWEGEIEIKSLLDGSVTNAGVERYKDLNGNHIEVLETGLANEDATFMTVRTKQSQIMLALVARTRVYEDNKSYPLMRENFCEEKKVWQTLKINCHSHRPICVEKIISLYSSRDNAISDPLTAAKKLNLRNPPLQELLHGHKREWKFLWERFNITLKGMDEETRKLRLHIFHLLQTVSHHSIGRDVSVPSRGLHGEAYRGHIFWDETFIFPFIYFRMPELARSLLMYRYRRLDEARHLAKMEGYNGAMFPWQSGSDGQEETQRIHLNPESGNWLPDNTHRQRHINGAIVYNIDKYFQVTNDREFLSLYGAEIVLEIAQFWVSLAQFNAEKKRFEIKGVVGPDEFHTKSPDGDDHGLNNNAYTNYLASWSIRRSLKMLSSLAESRRNELLEKVEVTPEDLDEWEHVSKNIFIPFHNDGIISQFEGFESLKEFDWETYRKKYNDLQRLDRILEAEGDSVDLYKVNKQGDVLMLFYLFSVDEIIQGLHWMGYQLGPGAVLDNVHYYLGHSSSGSSLSRIVHSWVLARTDRRHSWCIFQEALESDISDIQGGTTPEGIHLGAMSGSVDIVQRCFTGMEVTDGILWLNPQLPDELNGVKMALRFQGHWLCVELDHQELKISVERSWEATGKIGFHGQVYEFQKGTQFSFPLTGPGRTSQAGKLF
jgi:trehalose/maltose hydrolase-like predicted phosphorylase